MEMIIAILLWLQVMVGGGHYTQAQYDTMVQDNEAVINQVMLDPPMQTAIMQEYGLVAMTVVVADEE